MEMQVQFKKPVTIGSATYGKGVHDVPAADTKDNWFFDALVEEGSAIVLREESGEAQGEVANDAPATAEHSESASAQKSKGKSKATAKETGDA
jgi:hypothetical protein